MYKDFLVPVANVYPYLKIPTHTFPYMSLHFKFTNCMLMFLFFCFCASETPEGGFLYSSGSMGVSFCLDIHS